MLALGAWSCGAGSVSDGCPTGGCTSAQTVTRRFQTDSSSQIDVLFVIDDSPSLGGFQPAVAAAYPQIAQALENLTSPSGSPGLAGKPPSLHVGFVPASFGSAPNACPASPLRGAACGLPAPDQFLATSACGEQPNFEGSMPLAFSCMASFDVEDCGAPQPLAAMRRALGGDPRGGALAGRSPFSRDSATLQVIIISARDDASGSAGELEDVASFATFLKTLKPDPAKVLVSVIGPRAQDSPQPLLASAAPRLSELFEAFGIHGSYLSIESDSFLPALSALATRLAILIDPPCVTGVGDGDPTLDGVQPTCVVEDRAQQDDGSLTDAVLPSCERAGPPCWRMSSNFTLCPGGLLFQVDRGDDWCPQLSTWTEVSCVK